VPGRFFPGGGPAERGFPERRLAPSQTGLDNGDEVTVPYGGAELVESNVEVRTRIGKVKGMGLGVVVFLDGGDVADAGEHVDVGNLHWAAGIGLRLFTLVGAVRADVGYRLNRTGVMEPSPGDKYAFHLSIGEAF